jgi:hypothetical protein
LQRRLCRFRGADSGVGTIRPSSLETARAPAPRDCTAPMA